jgi:DNA-binding transcriptional LysR family regulator
MLDSLTLDQIRIFLTVADTGSFSKAAKQLNRAQSAVTYGIQKLEAQFGIPLFDRTAYRPALTEAGCALLPRARRIAEETNAFRDAARSLASGLEAELTIVLDSMFPMSAVVEALRVFTAKFPTVPPRIYVQSLGAAAELVLDGTCMIGLLPLFFSDMALVTMASCRPARGAWRTSARSTRCCWRVSAGATCPPIWSRMMLREED